MAKKIEFELKPPKQVFNPSHDLLQGTECFKYFAEDEIMWCEFKEFVHVFAHLSFYSVLVRLGLSVLDYIARGL